MTENKLQKRQKDRSNNDTYHKCKIVEVVFLPLHNSLNYEKLEGGKQGLSSVRVNDQYRIEFEEKAENGQLVATICNITDLSNHYRWVLKIPTEV